VRCAHCHEDNDLALKKAPPDLHGVFKHDKLPSGLPATDAQVRLNVLNGRGMMPGFAGRFDDEQMAALLALSAYRAAVRKRQAVLGCSQGLKPHLSF